MPIKQLCSKSTTAARILFQSEIKVRPFALRIGRLLTDKLHKDNETLQNHDKKQNDENTAIIGERIQ